MKNCIYWTWVWFIFLVCYCPVEAQRGNGSLSNLIYQPDAYIGEQGILAGSATNVAAVSMIAAPQFILLAERPFALAAWNQIHANFSFPFSNQAMAVGIMHVGMETYRQTKFDLLFSRAISQKWSIGGGFVMNLVRIAGYKPQSRWGYRIGALYRPMEKFTVCTEWERSALISNMHAGATIFPTDIRMELVMNLAAPLQLYLIWEKKQTVPASLGVAVRYAPHPHIVFRTGIHTSTLMYWLGCGISRGSWRFEVSAGFHPYLGITPGTILGWEKQLQPNSPSSPSQTLPEGEGFR